MKSLIIWVPSSDGAITMKFNNVTNFHAWPDLISYEYDGLSTGEHRFGSFNRENIIGYAITKEGTK